MRFWMRGWLKLLLALAVASSAAGCGGGRATVQYPLESVSDTGAGRSFVYRAAGRSVPDVARELIASDRPQQVSPENPERMFLVYPDRLVHLQRDPNRPADTLIEISDRAFVQQQYDVSFLQMYLLAEALDELFDAAKPKIGHYRGYTERDVYRPTTVYRAPTDADRKAAPPLTVDRKGQIFKRADLPPASSDAKIGGSGDVFKKAPVSVAEPSQRSTGSTGTIRKNTASGEVKPKSSVFSQPRPRSPPKTRVGSKGRIMVRR